METAEMDKATEEMEHVKVRARKLVDAIEAAESKEAAVALAEKALQRVGKDAVIMSIGLFTDLTAEMLDTAKAVTDFIE